MTSIGVRELRQRASAWLRRVEQGETIEVTDRGRPIALLSPVPAGSPLDRLRALGEIDAAVGEFEDVPEPLILPPGIPAPSEVLKRLRRNER